MDKHQQASACWCCRPGAVSGPCSNFSTTQMRHSQQPYRLPSVPHGLSHGLRRSTSHNSIFSASGKYHLCLGFSSPHKTKVLRGPLSAQRFAIFAPVCALVPPFQALASVKKVPAANAARTFLAGALGLEPRAYGFGDRRSTN